MEDLKIGLTRSGRSIHLSALDKAHNSFKTEDREDAIKLNKVFIKRYEVLIKKTEDFDDRPKLSLYRDALAYHKANVAIYNAINVLGNNQWSMNTLIVNHWIVF